MEHEEESVESGAAIRVEVAYALAGRQKIIELMVNPGCTALEAAELSGINLHFPQIEIKSAAMGIFSKRLDGKSLPEPKDYQLQPGNRVEIYRPLEADPKEARMQRVEKARRKERQQSEKARVGK